MGLKIYAAGASAVVIAMMAFAVSPAEAQQTKKKSVTNQSRVVVASRARTRVRVAPRSFLDAGTEVLPGDRKFTDYALPAGEIGAPLGRLKARPSTAKRPCLARPICPAVKIRGLELVRRVLSVTTDCVRAIFPIAGR